MFDGLKKLLGEVVGMLVFSSTIVHCDPLARRADALAHLWSGLQVFANFLLRLEVLWLCRGSGWFEKDSTLGSRLRLLGGYR